MIEFYQEDIVFDFNFVELDKWLLNCLISEGFSCGDVTYVFCSDAYLLELNQRFLDHDTYTDVISFDETLGKTVCGDIFISIDRVRENALKYGVSFNQEVLRVAIHGLLHFMGYEDKKLADQEIMRNKENSLIELFHVEH